jgi:YidC/Oxa1 family membrane protein insertase
MMKLYKEHGVNPLGGCLPMLLQMPVLFSLFIVFRSTIQLRNQPFIWWIDDLSAPDTLNLGFELPFIGDSIHVLPILMGITMIWQSKMSMTDPKQKFMIYFMPVFLIFIFYSLPSGLNLYYAIFNLLSMVQTRMIKKRMHPEGETKPAKTESKPQKSASGRSKRKK